MECQRKPQFFCFLHGRHNEFFIYQRNTVIGKSGGSGLCQRFHIREFFPLQAFGDGRCLQHMDQESGVFTDRGYIAYQGALSLEELMAEGPVDQCQREQEVQMGGMA